MFISDEEFSSQIKVASPCKVPWGTMTGDEKIKHCQQCNKNVYNISEMTRDEAIDLLARAEGKERVCIAFYRRQDGSVITSDCPVGVKLARDFKKRGLKLLASAVTLLVSLLPASAKENAKNIIDSTKEAPYGKLYDLSRSNRKSNDKKIPDTKRQINALPKTNLDEFIRKSKGNASDFIYGEAESPNLFTSTKYTEANKIKAGSPTSCKPGTLLDSNWYKSGSFLMPEETTIKKPFVPSFEFVWPDSWKLKDKNQSPGEAQK